MVNATVIKGNVSYGGTLHRNGETFALEQTVFERLKNAGFVKAANGAPAAATTPASSPAGEESVGLPPLEVKPAGKKKNG